MKSLIRSAVVTALVAGTAVAATSFGPTAAVAPPDAGVFINELHYDNVSDDEGEAVEIFGPTCTDLTGWSIEFYNGSASQLNVYATASLSGFIPDLGGGFGVVSIAQSGIQNGAPDGLALVDGGGAVQQFFSYEGTFVPTSGAAVGLTPTELPVDEATPSAVGDSVQLQGTGSIYEDFTWSSGTATFGDLGPITPSGAGGDPASCDLDGGGEPADAHISELHYDNDGTDVGEAVEVYGNAGGDLTDWTIALYNGNGGGVYDTITLGGTIPDEVDGLGAVSFPGPSNGIQNGAPDGLALVDPDGAVVEFLSYEGVFVAAGGPADGMTSVDIGVEEPGAADASLQLAADPCGGPMAWVGPQPNTFGALGLLVTDPDACNPDPIEVKIHEVQGTGGDSPLVGQRVIVEGIVVGDEEGPAPALRGFFVQEQDDEVDADPVTSEGIFVYNFDDDDVDVGDRVRVEGTVEERFGNTQLTDFVVIEQLTGDGRIASAATVEFPVTSVDDLEAFEGMVATFPQDLVISEYFDYDRFGEIVVALPAPGESRPYTPTAVFPTDSPEAAARAELNINSRITIDDGNSFQNPDDPIHPINREPFSLDNDFRGGDTVSGLTGPVFYSFNLYRVLPYGDGDGYDTYEQTEAPAVPDDVGGDVTVGALNALNYFLTLDDGVNDVCGPAQTLECRGADDAEEFDRQRVKLLNTLVGIDADVVGLVEIENRPGVEPLADIVTGLNASGSAGIYDYVAAGVDSIVGTDAIKVGVIYRPDAVTPLGEPAILDTPEFIDPNNTGSPKNRAAVAQTFVDNDSGEVFSVVVNHLKSKGSGCGPGDDDPLAGNCNLTRTLSAEILTDWLATDPTGVDDDDWLILGDLNAYDREAPIDALRDAGYTDLVGEYQGELAYSYVFDGQFGYLDYVLSSESLTAQVTGATEWHINSDTPDIFDYDTSFKSDYQDTLFDPTTPYRSSDHDAALVGLSLSSFDAKTIAVPGLLWPANHTMRSALVLSLNRNGLVDSAIVGATSSEADSGLGRRDRPGDIELVDEWVIRLRAEAFDRPGRMYTIDVRLSEPGQVRFDTATVGVPRSLLGWLFG